MKYYDLIESKHYEIADTGCWLWLKGKYPNGYGFVNVMRDSKRTTTGAHRVSYQQSKGDIPTGYCVLHKCDVRACISPEHLFLGTHKDNTQDCMRKGRFSARKLTEEDVREIKHFVEEGHSQASVARDYLVSRQAVNLIVNNKTWSTLSIDTRYDA
jgi:hypothetical protein